MTDTTVAAVDAITLHLLKSDDLVKKAAELKGYTLDHGYLHIGDFELDDKLLDEFCLPKYDFLFTSGRLASNGMASLEMRHSWLPWRLSWWSSDGRPTINVRAVLRLSRSGGEIEAAASIQVLGANARLDAKLPVNVAISDSEFSAQKSRILAPIAALHPELPMLKRLSDCWGVRIARIDELGFGKLKTVRELFDEFTSHKELRKKLADSEKLSPFRPEKVWGLYAPEHLWNDLKVGWHYQLQQFKRAL